MEFQQHTLANGIRIIHKQKQGIEVSHCGILINAGSRDELPEEQGLAHFIEHSLFKGTTKRKAFHILSRLDAVGGELNAYTSKEETAIYASFVSNHYERAVELLADITFNSTYPIKEIEKEKDVIVDEIHSYLDSPGEQIFDDFEEQIFGDHAIGRNILGTIESVRGFGQQNILDFVRRMYRTNEMVFASVGSIDFKKVVKFAEKYFGAIPNSSAKLERVPFLNYQPKHVEIKRHTHQIHYILGCVAYDANHDYKRGLVLLNNYLGGPGMNSRLNLNIREKHGIAYNIESSYQPFTDSGIFNIYLGTDQAMFARSKKLLNIELRKMREQKLGTSQLQLAKQQLIGHIALAQESGAALMLALGKSALLYEKVDSTQEIYDQINEITANDLLAIANEVFDESKMSSLTYL
jgi:predicted Zn-dependent peptidase